ncbi:MAG: hypothetical protein ACTHK5_02665, partial [Tsuneonella sp.]
AMCGIANASAAAPSAANPSFFIACSPKVVAAVCRDCHRLGVGRPNRLSPGPAPKRALINLNF